jgi:phospholipid N-methyltransferase|tara:strand:+ start:8726 stop:8932 length:207 start_codon:yes stop_codon:yes gene_type:complete
MKYNPGDIVEVEKFGRKFTACIVSGIPVSLYVEDRPVKIIDEVSYRLVSNNECTVAYGYQIKRKLNEE